MKAIVVRETGGVEKMNLETVPDPVANDHDVVIRVDACGVCMHDVVVRNGTMKAGVQLPVILGHEIAGTVVDVGPKVHAFKAGDRVATAQRYHICGACRLCRSGHETSAEVQPRPALAGWRQEPRVGNWNPGNFEPSVSGCGLPLLTRQLARVRGRHVHLPPSPSRAGLPRGSWIPSHRKPRPPSQVPTATSRSKSTAPRSCSRRLPFVNSERENIP